MQAKNLLPTLKLIQHMKPVLMMEYVKYTKMSRLYKSPDGPDGDTFMYIRYFKTK